MGLDYDSCTRVGTRILNEGEVLLEDQCVIFPDDLNDGYHIALSKKNRQGRMGRNTG